VKSSDDVIASADDASDEVPAAKEATS
jgi:hypothetical protein